MFRREPSVSTQFKTPVLHVNSRFKSFHPVKSTSSHDLPCSTCTCNARRFASELVARCRGRRSQKPDRNHLEFFLDFRSCSSQGRHVARQGEQRHRHPRARFVWTGAARSSLTPELASSGDTATGLILTDVYLQTCLAGFPLSGRTASAGAQGDRGLSVEAAPADALRARFRTNGRAIQRCLGFGSQVGLALRRSAATASDDAAVRLDEARGARASGHCCRAAR